MALISQLHHCITDKIDDAIMRKDLQPHELYEPIRYILSNGGKRIRSALTLLACRTFSGDHRQAISAAAGLEVFHNFTLLHDDIMDKAPIRRGKPTVHVKWDENTAILSGDAMMFLSAELMSEVPHGVLKQVLQLFNKTALQVCEGQQMDMNLESLKLDDVSNTGDAYIEMIRLKTSVLLAACLQTGAIIGGADTEEQQLMYDAGISLGLGFQLQDDLLDSFGDEAVFGKKIGGDILARKKTFLVSAAMEQGTPNERKTLTALYNASTVADNTCIGQIQNIFIDSGAKKAIEARIIYYFDNAHATLGKIKARDADAKKVLQDLFNQVSLRNI